MECFAAEHGPRHDNGNRRYRCSGEKSLPSAARGQHQWEENAELRLVGEDADESASQNRPGLQIYEREPYERRRQETVLACHRVDEDGRHRASKKRRNSAPRDFGNCRCEERERARNPDKKSRQVGQQSECRGDEENDRWIVPPQISVKLMARCGHLGGVMKSWIVGRGCGAFERGAPGDPHFNEVRDDRVSRFVQNPGMLTQHDDQA